MDLTPKLRFNFGHLPLLAKSGTLIQEKRKHPHKESQVNVHSSTVHHKPQTEAIKMSTTDTDFFLSVIFIQWVTRQ